MNTTVLRYSVIQLSVINNLPKDDSNLHISIEQKLHYELMFSELIKHPYIGVLSLQAKEKTDSSRFNLEVALEIVFEIDDKEKLNNKEIHDTTFFEFLPYLSSYVGLLSALTGFPPMIVVKPDLNAQEKQD